MIRKDEHSRKQLFMDRMTTQRPITVTDIQQAKSGTLFFNAGSILKDAPPHLMNFKFTPRKAKTVPINSLLNCVPQGYYTVSGMITWKEEAQFIEKNKTWVGVTLLTENTGTINLSLWGKHIETVKESSFYTITDCKLRSYYGNCLTTKTESKISEAKKQDLSSVTKQTPSNDWICCPSILNVVVNCYPVCNNKDCSKKISSGNPTGSRVLRCLACGRSMLLSNCLFEMNINMHLDKDDTIHVVTVFPKVLGQYLNEDIYS